MNLSDYKALPLKEQLAVLERQGQAVLAVHYYGYKVTLHAWQHHYLEVFFHLKRSMVEKIMPLGMRCSRIPFYADQLVFSPCLTSLTLKTAPNY